MQTPPLRGNCTDKYRPRQTEHCWWQKSMRKWDTWQGLLLCSQEWGGLWKKTRLDLFDVWWSCWMPFIILNIDQNSEQRGGGSPASSWGAGNILPSLLETQHWYPQCVPEGHGCFKWLGFFFSFCLSWCLPVASHLILILFWKMDGSRPFSDSFHCGNEGKVTGTAHNLQVNCITSALLTDILAWENWLATLCPGGIIELSTDRQWADIFSDVRPASAWGQTSFLWTWMVLVHMWAVMCWRGRCDAESCSLSLIHS